MKSTHPCPACSQSLDVAHYESISKLWCGSVHCTDKTCAKGEEFEPKFGQDTQEAYAKLLARFERLKGAAKE